MSTMVRVRLTPEEASRMRSVHSAIAHELGVKREDLGSVRIVRESIDARRKQVYYDRTYEVAEKGETLQDAYERTTYRDCSKAPQVVVVGAGPAGLFAALRLLEIGLKPVIVERGMPVEQRRKDIARMGTSKVVDEESNYCFGEGGAGAFSDGKLFTRSTARGDVRKVLAQFCQHGADTSILYETHPHIGSDKLPDIIRKIRTTIQNNGGEFHFQSTVEDLLFAKDGSVNGVVTTTGRTYEGPVVLATGHSADDLFRRLDTHGVSVLAKGIAVGVRLEHPQEVVDRMQYHNAQGRGSLLPPADYAFVTQVAGRGVYSFCMCPGGVVVPSCVRDGYLSVNGMSSSLRAGRWANSGMVVELHPEDLAGSRFAGNLGMLDFVEALERKSWRTGGGRLVAPAQRMVDFLEGKLSSSLPATSYWPGLMSTDLATLLPSFIASRLKQAFKVFGEKGKGFVTNDALLVASETRTSSPVRILRDERYMACSHPGLFPCGEGAGYAGGIVSAALDGMAVADAVKGYLG